MDEKGIWFTNLLLLGFDPIANEAKYKILFNRDMFDLPNTKGMEVVLYFLFLKLNPAKATTEFRDCWPVFDKKHEQGFRKVCSLWFAAIARDDAHSGLPRQAASLLLSPEGKKFYSLLLNFTFHCLKTSLLQDIKKLGNKVGVHSAISDGRGSIDPTFNDVYDHSLSIGIVNHTHHVITKLRTMSHVTHPQWRQFALELKQEYRSVLKKKNELMAELSRLKTEHSSLNLSKPIRENEREALKVKVNKLWKEVESFTQSIAEERLVLESLVKPSHDCHVIDGKNLQYKIPTELSAATEDDEGAPSVTNNNELVSLTDLVKVGNEGLSLLQKQLNQGVRSSDLISLTEELEFAQGELNHHRGHVQSALFTRSMLVKLQDDLKKSIPELEETNEMLRQEEDSNQANNTWILKLPPSSSLNPSNLSISLPPPSPAPPIVLEASNTPNSTPLRQSPLPHRYTIATPVAINEISAGIKQHVRTQSDTKGVSSLIQTRHTPYRKSGKASITRSTRIPKAPQAKESKLPSLPLELPSLSTAVSYPMTITPTVSSSSRPIPILQPSISSTVPTIGPIPIPPPVSSPNVAGPIPISSPSVSLFNTTRPIPIPSPGHTHTTGSILSGPLPPTTEQPLPHNDTSSRGSTTTPIITGSKPSYTAEIGTETTGIVHESPSKVDTTIDRIADEIADLVCNEDTPIKSDNPTHSNEYEAFVTKEKLLRTPSAARTGPTSTPGLTGTPGISSTADKTGTTSLTGIAGTTATSGPSTIDITGPTSLTYTAGTTGTSASVSTIDSIIKTSQVPSTPAIPTSSSSQTGTTVANVVSTPQAPPIEDDNDIISTSSSVSDFNLLANDIPPTPYRELDLLSPDGTGTRLGTRARSTNGAIPFLNMDDSD